MGTRACGSSVETRGPWPNSPGLAREGGATGRRVALAFSEKWGYDPQAGPAIEPAQHDAPSSPGALPSAPGLFFFAPHRLTVEGTQSRKAAADAAGISDHQRKTMQRAANVPEDEFAQLL
jgi:hypothetical protein